MTSTISLALLVILMVSTVTLAAHITAEDVGFEVGTLAFPMGDPEAGRFVFSQFRCHSCHRVSEDREWATPIAALPGPELGVFQANQNACTLASSLISPSHIISEEIAAQSEGQLSPMGGLTEIMTVRQLIDLVAYLKSIGEVE